MYKYPPSAGIGHDTRAEKVVMRDIVFAFVKGFTWSIALNRNTGKIEKAAKYRALSNTAERTARCKDPRGAIMSRRIPRKPIA